MKETQIEQSSKSNTQDSFLELEETLIPYPNSIDIESSNEKKYMLRLERPFQFEQQLLLSRFTPYDNEDYSSLLNRFAAVVNWFHSTVYNYEDSVLDRSDSLLQDTSAFFFGPVLDQLASNHKAVKEVLFFNDLVLVSGSQYYRYILSRNQLLFRGTLDRNDLADQIIDSDGLTMQAEEMILVLAHPRRGSNIWGEHAYQKAMVSAGELLQIIQFISSQLEEIRLRLHQCFYDYSFLCQLGIEDSNSIPIASFECHKKQE